MVKRNRLAPIFTDFTWRLFSDFFADEGLERLRKLIRADDPGDNQLFKEGNLIPFAGPFLNEGISAIINLGPFSGHSFERFNETYKALNIFLQLTKCAPNFTGNPIKCLWNGLWGLDPCSSHRHEPHFRWGNLILGCENFYTDQEGVN